MKKMFVTPSELVRILNNVSGCKFVSVSYATAKDANNKKLSDGKKNEYYDRVETMTTLSGVQFNASYENAVNNRIGNNGDGNGEKAFTAESLPWGSWIVPNKTIEHNGNLYVRLYVTKSCKEDKVYLVDGCACSKEEAIKVKAAFRPSSPSKRQEAVGIEEKEQVKPFTLNAKSINQFTINGVTYIVATALNG